MGPPRHIEPMERARLSRADSAQEGGESAEPKRKQLVCFCPDGIPLAGARYADCVKCGSRHHTACVFQKATRMRRLDATQCRVCRAKQNTMTPENKDMNKTLALPKQDEEAYSPTADAASRKRTARKRPQRLRAAQEEDEPYVNAKSTPRKSTPRKTTQPLPPPPPSPLKRLALDKLTEVDQILHEKELIILQMEAEIVKLELRTEFLYRTVLWKAYCNMWMDRAAYPELAELTRTHFDMKQGMTVPAHPAPEAWVAEMKDKVQLMMELAVEDLVEYVMRPWADMYPIDDTILRGWRELCVWMVNRGPLRGDKRKELGVLLELMGLVNKGTYYNARATT